MELNKDTKASKKREIYKKIFKKNNEIEEKKHINKREYIKGYYN